MQMRFFFFFYFLFSFNLFAQDIYNVVYVDFFTINNRVLLIDKIKTIVSELDDEFIFYSSDINYQGNNSSLEFVSNKNVLLDDLDNFFPYNPNNLGKKAQVKNFNSYLSEKEIFNKLTSGRVLSNSINFYFFFEYEDFIYQKKDREVINKILLSNRLINNQFSLNKKCKVVVYLYKDIEVEKQLGEVDYLEKISFYKPIIF